MKPDHLNQRIGVLTRREVEARILAPMIDAFQRRWDQPSVMATVQDCVVKIAREQGAQLRHEAGGDTLRHFAAALDAWTQDDALEVEMLAESSTRFEFNVTRCRYAELYQALGIPELGTVLSCARDFALIEGFNPAIKLQRSQTIMSGAAYCDFRYRLETAR
jgi:hypothetical protein